MDVTTVFFGICLILFFGYFAEYLFRRTGVPDVLLLIILGILLGPHVFDLVPLDALGSFTSIFTTFALLFLIFDGSFNIDLASFAKGFPSAISLTFFNFLVSTVLASVIFFAVFHQVLISLFAGFILGGISSSFVMPVLKRVKVTATTYSILALEGTLTDVLCIASGVTMIEIINLHTFTIQAILTRLIQLFAVAGFIGIIGGFLWIYIMKEVFEEEKSYIMTIAFLILIYVIADIVGGNGAIAALFFGLVLKNSKLLSRMLVGAVNLRASERQILAVISKEERFFYEQISFFLKTFFFVYVGLLLNITDSYALLIGLIIATFFLLGRRFSGYLVRDLPAFDRQIVMTTFARGIAAAVIVQIAIRAGLPYAAFISNIVYVVITVSIVYSSVGIFLAEKKAKLFPETARRHA